MLRVEILKLQRMFGVSEVGLGTCSDSRPSLVLCIVTKSIMYTIGSMKAFLRKNLILLVAFSLPILLIVLIALSAYIPSLFVSTNYNFVYAVCTGSSGNYYPYRCDEYLQKRYSVVSGQLVVNEVDVTIDSDNDGVPDFTEDYTARLFLHDTETNESREIPLEEAQSLSLNELITSPDGVSVTSAYDSGTDFLLVFNGGSAYGYYLVKGNAKRSLNLLNGDSRYSYQDNFKFIGWVVSRQNQ